MIIFKFIKKSYKAEWEKLVRKAIKKIPNIRLNFGNNVINPLQEFFDIAREAEFRKGKVLNLFKERRTAVSPKRFPSRKKLNIYSPNHLGIISLVNIREKYSNKPCLRCNNKALTKEHLQRKLSSLGDQGVGNINEKLNALFSTTFLTNREEEKKNLRRREEAKAHLLKYVKCVKFCREE